MFLRGVLRSNFVLGKQQLWRCLFFTMMLQGFLITPSNHNSTEYTYFPGLGQDRKNLDSTL